MILNIDYKNAGFRICSGRRGWWAEERKKPNMPWMAIPGTFKTLKECSQHLTKIMVRDIPYSDPKKIQHEFEEIIIAVGDAFRTVHPYIRKA